MGIDVAIVSERHEVIVVQVDPTSIFPRILPSSDDPTYQCLNKIDRYGDTTFNYLQTPVVIAELQRLLATVESTEARALLMKTLEYAQQVSEGNHLYLKFIGD